MMIHSVIHMAGRTTNSNALNRTKKEYGKRNISPEHGERWSAFVPEPYY